MNWDLIFLVVFYLILYSIFRKYRDKFEVQWKIFALYKTKIGLNLMDRIAKRHPKLLGFLANISIFIGFLGMALTLGFLIKGGISLFGPMPTPQVAPILPGVTIEGLPKLSFWHWIIGILAAATFHEFMHGVYSRLNKIRIKSSGFAFLGPILAAFVEPDEKELESKSTKAQLSVLSAGPFANIVLGLLILIFMMAVIAPLGNSIAVVNGVEIGGLNESFSIYNSGIKTGDIITEIDGVKLDSTDKLKNVLSNKKPGDIIGIVSDGKKYKIELGENPQKKDEAFIGIVISKFNTNPKYEGKFFKGVVKVFEWFSLLFFWLFNINIGIGLFNLLPLGPVDGGRMFYSAVFHFVKNKVKSLRILNYVSLFVLFLIILNMWPFIVKLFSWILSPVAALF